jgi:lantibiotic biosynthesis protein
MNPMVWSARIDKADGVAPLDGPAHGGVVAETVWQPLITEDPDGRRAAIVRVIEDIVAALDGVAVDGVGDACGRAVLRAYLAEGDVVPDPDDASSEALSDAVTRFAHTRLPAGLFGGAAGLGWTVAHLADSDTAELVCGKIDKALLGQLAATADYDLIAGLVGFGVYALERGPAGQPLATAVLDELARRARPRDGGLAWHTPASVLPVWHDAPEGYWNLGLAHGLPGVVGLLARFVAADVEAARARELLAGAMAALLAAERPFAAWITGGPDATAGAPTRGPERLAWCYNDLGAVFALLAAAQATGDSTWRGEALALASSCAARGDAQARIDETCLCHGALGVAHLFARLHHATGDTELRAAALRWLDRGLALRNDRPIAGFPFRLPGDREAWHPDSSILTGVSGVALVLHSFITAVEPSWDRLLLVEDLALRF